jgi:hypothetical protein
MKDEKKKDLTLDVDKNKDLVEDKGLEKGIDPNKMTEREKAEKEDRQEHDDIEDAPESGTVIQKEDPSRPKNAEMVGEPDDYGQAPESGTIREN